VDVVLTNPPFGGIEEPGIEAGLPRRCAHQGNGRPVPGAHQAHPQGQRPRRRGAARRHAVRRRREDRIKEQLLAECNLHTIVRLPNGVFAPYTGIKTNLLFFTKGSRRSTSGTTSTPTRAA
jgi:type I restriction enzyme M protein